jgi:hypothetical protein
MNNYLVHNYLAKEKDLDEQWYMLDPRSESGMTARILFPLCPRGSCTLCSSSTQAGAFYIKTSILT